MELGSFIKKGGSKNETISIRSVVNRADFGGDTAVRVCEGNRCGDQYAENGSHGC